MSTLKDDALCIRHWDWSETSQTVSLFTREHGILRGLAKGSRREKSPFSGGLELATRGEIVAIVKAQHAAGGLATFTAWDLQETFPAVRTSHLGFRISMALLDALGRSMRETDPHPALFEYSLHTLRDLSGPPADQYAALAGFLLVLLKETGHAPELFVDVRSGEVLKDAAIVGFSPQRGGVTGHTDNAQNEGVWGVRAETLALLRHLAKPESERGAHTEATLRRAVALLAAYLRHVTESDIPALAALQAYHAVDAT